MLRASPIVALLLVTAACQDEQAPGNHAANNAAVGNEVAVSPEAASTNAGEASTPQTPPPAPSEPAPTPDEAKSPAAAVAVLQRYCAAIARNEFARAYRLWAGDGEASGMSEREFAQSFAKYDAFDCSFGTPGPIEGAAGSAYITVPVVVTGTLTKGGGFALRGPMTLRRVNDVPGSTEAQRRWHISASEVKL